MPAPTIDIGLSHRYGLTRLALLICLTIVATPLSAFDFAPSIETSVVYTDNLNLAEPDDEIDEFVFLIEPNLQLTHETQRVSVDVDYTFSYLYYEDIGEDSIFHDGSAALGLELIDDVFSIDSIAVIEQQVTEPEGVLFFSNVPIIDNRTDSVRLETTPRLTQPLFGGLLDISYTAGTVDYDTPDIQDLDLYQTIETSFASAPRDKGLTWGVAHEYLRYEYERPPVSKYQQAVLIVNYDFVEADDFQLFGELGAESDVFQLGDDDLEEAIWEVGIRQRTANTRWEVGLGDRSFGTTKRAFFERRVLGTLIGLSYTEEPRVQEILFRDRGANEELGLPNSPQTIDRPGQNVRFVRERAEASITRETDRNRIVLLGFWDERENVADAEDPDLATLNADEEVGATLTWDHEFGVRTSGTAQVGWADRDFSSGNEDTVLRFYLEGRYSLGQKTRLKAWFSRTKQYGTDARQPLYTEHQVGLTVVRDFL